MNVKKQAAQDAYEFALADLFYGEGAGTRRKLIKNTVAWNTERVTGYKEAFDAALAQLDFADLTKKAVAERKKLDRIAAASRNIKALGRGDLRGASTAVVVLVGGAWVAHETGFDAVVFDEAKRLKRKAKARYAALKLRRGF